MIAILGSSKDDISYIKQKMAKVETVRCNQELDFYLGKYAGKDVVLAVMGDSNILSAMVTAICIEKFRPYLIINIGTVTSVDVRHLPLNSYLVGERVYTSDVDFTATTRNKYGQLPGYPMFFIGNVDLGNTIVEGNAGLPNSVKIRSGEVLSSDKFYVDMEEYGEKVNTHFAKLENLMAIDNSSGGVATVAYSYDLPFLVIKSVNYELGVKDQMIARVRRGLEQSVIIAQVIMKIFENIDRSDN
ncbi:MAG: 5'-methylthioadenosine/S-adenosylhomocysteine nucleosidase [Acholeplasmataceae bacterium]